MKTYNEIKKEIHYNDVLELSNGLIVSFVRQGRGSKFYAVGYKDRKVYKIPKRMKLRKTGEKDDVSEEEKKYRIPY